MQQEHNISYTNFNKKIENSRQVSYKGFIHHSWHLSSGFIGESAAQEKALENSSLLVRAPNTLYNNTTTYEESRCRLFFMKVLYTCMYGKYSTRGHVKSILFLSWNTHSSDVFFVHTSKGGALILYFLVVFSRSDFLSTQTFTIFSDQAISKYSYIRFLVVETIFRISFAIVLAVYDVMHVINRAILVIRWSVSTYRTCGTNSYIG